MRLLDEMLHVGRMQTSDSVPDLSDLTSWTVPFAAASVPDARTKVARALEDRDLAGSVVEEARLVVTELVTNALRHARPLSGGVLRVDLAVGNDVIRLAVEDGGSSSVPQLMHPPPLSTNGRGLEIVRALSLEWGVREHGVSNTVFAVLRR